MIRNSKRVVFYVCWLRHNQKKVGGSVCWFCGTVCGTYSSPCASWTCKIWKCRNLPEGPLSEEKWRRVLCTTILLNFRSEYVPDRLGKSSCKVQQPRRHSGRSFDVSARWFFQIVDNLPIVNLRRQNTIWKLACHPKMTNSGVRTSQDNDFQ